MALFKIQDKSVIKIPPKSLDKERQIQTLFEENLEELLGIRFLTSEFSTSFGGRIDTLGIDKNGSPVIIEYKKGQNDNVINQGLSYLRWLLDHREKFENLVTEKLANLMNSPVVTWNGQIVTKQFVDWDSPRVICVAESYSKFDLDTVEMLPIHVELLKFRMYEDGILSVEPESDQKIKISLHSVAKKNSQTQTLQKSYTIEDHLQKADKNIQTLFQELREKIMGLDEDIKEEPKKLYIVYKLTTNFTDVSIMYGSKPHYIKLWLNIKSGQLNDPQNLARDLAKPKPIGHWGNGDYEVKLEKSDQLNDVLELIKQAYNLNK